MHVPNKQGLWWMTIRIRLKVIIAIVAAVVGVVFGLLILASLRFHLVAIVIVVFFRMGLVLHDVVVDILYVLLR